MTTDNHCDLPPCPHDQRFSYGCLALAGQPCLNPDHTIRRKPHAARVKLARTWTPPRRDPETGQWWAPVVRVDAVQVAVVCPHCGCEHLHGHGDGSRAPDCPPAWNVPRTIWQRGIVKEPRQRFTGYVVVGCPGRSFDPQASARYWSTRVREALADHDVPAVTAAWVGLGNAVQQMPATPELGEAWRRLGAQTATALRPDELDLVRSALGWAAPSERQA